MLLKRPRLFRLKETGKGTKEMGRFGKRGSVKFVCPNNTDPSVASA